ncbi:MAG: tetratricopeptide repeat protein [Deltaproteobacteria bacterium]|nr:tetratricopeptide repeat protein [Deltaproteobacteria bacterium]
MRLRVIRRFLVSGIVVLALSAAARANVRSQALYARGLIPFNAGRWAESFQLFNQAVEADANDALAWYYRGLTSARQGMTDEAAHDIEKALQISPNLPHATLDLGIAYFSAGKHADAKRTLQKAAEQGYEPRTVAFFLGLVSYRLGEDSEAANYFKDAKADPELRGAAQYYLALVEVKQGDTEAARSELAGTAHDLSQSEIGRAAQDYIANGGAAPTRPATRWSLYGDLHFEYDSNVTIGPSSTFANTRDISGRSDERVVIGAGGRYSFLDSDVWSLVGTYDFSQSVHFDLTQYDLQGHRLGLELASHRGILRYGIAGNYDFFALNYQSFYQEGLATPWLTFDEGGVAATQLYYRLRGRDFFRAPYDPGRDAINHAFGLRQFLELGDPERVLFAGYQFDIEDTVSNGPQGKTFQYEGHQFEVGLMLPISDSAHSDAAYLFRHDDYDSVNSGFGKKRRDDEHQVVVGLGYTLNANWAFDVHYIGTFNDSNIRQQSVSFFDYDRHIVSFGARFTY